MDWPQFTGWAFQSLLAGVTIYGVTRATGAMEKISDRMDTISDSVQDLNAQMAVIIDRDKRHDRLLEMHDQMIRDLQAQQRKYTS